MMYEVIVRQGYDAMSYMFENEAAAMSFATCARASIRDTFRNDGGRKEVNVSIRILTDADMAEEEEE